DMTASRVGSSTPNWTVIAIASFSASTICRGGVGGQGWGARGGHPGGTLTPAPSLGGRGGRGEGVTVASWAARRRRAMSTARVAVETRDQALRARARRVIPGGMYGHQSATTLPPEFPQFMERGRGSRVWDVDGREYLDFMCSFGPIVLGHAHPRV